MLNVAVCGLGWWGRVIVPLAKSSAKLRVVRVVDPDPAAADFASSQKVPLSSFDDALKDPSVQGVVLCTPHTLHTDQIVRAANAGKHVFCEKPLSLSRSEVLRAIDAINRRKLTLAVGHEKRFEPPNLVRRIDGQRFQQRVSLFPRRFWILRENRAQHVATDTRLARRLLQRADHRESNSLIVPARVGAKQPREFEWTSGRER